MEWEEPHDSALYCMQTDGNHMIASGSSYYGVVRLWDKRRTECLQVGSWFIYCTIMQKSQFNYILSCLFDIQSCQRIVHILSWKSLNANFTPILLIVSDIFKNSESHKRVENE